MILNTISNDCTSNESINVIINNNCAHTIWLIVLQLLSQFKIISTTIHLTHSKCFVNKLWGATKFRSFND